MAITSCSVITSFMEICIGTASLWMTLTFAMERSKRFNNINIYCIDPRPHQVHSAFSQLIHAHAPVPAALPVAGKPTQCLQFLADQAIHDAMSDQQHRPLGGQRNKPLGGNPGAPPADRQRIGSARTTDQPEQAK